MAKQRPSVQKREREFKKRERERKKREKAAMKRARRESGSPDETLPPIVIRADDGPNDGPNDVQPPQTELVDVDAAPTSPALTPSTRENDTTNA